MDDSCEIAARRHLFVEAYNGGDIDVMSEVVTTDTVGAPPRRRPFVGVSASQAFWRESLAAAQHVFRISPQEAQVVGDTAIDSFGWSIDVTPKSGGPTVHDEGECIWIWRRDVDGAWRVAQSIWNSSLSEPAIHRVTGSA